MKPETAVSHLIVGSLPLLLLEVLVLLAILTGQPVWVLIPLTWTMLPVARSVHAVIPTALGLSGPQR
jgi:hypothetical protein